MPQHTEKPQAHELSNKEVFSRIATIWKEIASRPQDWLADMSKHNLAFAAGGGLPSRFGLAAESEIWQAVLATQREGTVQVAGIEFSIAELELVGSFYRFLHAQGVAEHCIDERLIDDLENQQTEVHEACGACAAIGSSAAIPQNVEDLLLGELGQENFGKQPINNDMHEHTSVAILIDLHGADIVAEEKRAEVRASQALPFNVSLPLEKIAAWAQEQRESGLYQANDLESLLLALAKWNVRIARNIIGGDHNSLNELAAKTLLIIDRRGVDEHPLAPQMLEALTQALEGAKYEQMLFVGESSLEEN